VAPRKASIRSSWMWTRFAGGEPSGSTALADQARGGAVEDAAHEKAAGPGDADDGLGELGGPAGGQRPRGRRLDAHGVFPTRIAAGDDLVDAAPPVGDVTEVARTARDQSLVAGGPEVAIGDSTDPFSRGAPGLQRLASRPWWPRKSSYRFATSFAASAPRLRWAEEGSAEGPVELRPDEREAVGAMRAWNPAEGPEGVPEVLGARGEALAAEDDGGVLPAAVGQDEVEEAARERRAAEGDAEFGGVGEVRQRHAARLGRLAEDHVPWGSVQRAPVARPPLQRPADAVVGEGLGIGHPRRARRRRRLRGGAALKDRRRRRLPDRPERIRNGAAALGLALRRRTGVGLDPARGAIAEPGPDGGDAPAVTMSVMHVKSHLLVGDGFARHDGTSAGLQRSRSYRPAAASTHADPRGRRARRRLQSTAGLRPPSGWRRRPTWLSAPDRMVVADHSPLVPTSQSSGN
jgi:hypothetical protein